MRLEVNDQILRCYADLPEVFRASDIFRLTQLTNDTRTISRSLQNLKENGLILKGSKYKWFKKYATIEKWLKDYIAGKITR